MTSLEAPDFTRELDALTFGAAALEPRAGEHPPPRPLEISRIVAAVDGSPLSDDVASWTRDLAATFGARACIVHAIAPRGLYTFYSRVYGWPASVDPYVAAANEGDVIIDRALSTVRARSAKALPYLVPGSAAESILEISRDEKADLVVLGSRGRGRAQRLLLGSVSDAVKNHATTSVLIVKNGPPPKKVLSAVDGSRSSALAADLGMRIARLWKVPSIVLHVLPHLEHGPAGVGEKLRERFERNVAGVRAGSVEFRLAEGDPASVVRDTAASENAGLVVMGSRGLGGWQRLTGGSVSNRVAHECESSVLLVREKA